jgi:alpha-aminoadipic semialdehyde synthase
MGTIGIRLEDKNEWERRVPFSPSQVKRLIEEFKYNVLVQPSKIRAFTDKEYELAGATLTDNIWETQAIFAIKEIPVDFIYPNNVYVFFSHVIKGQKYNMPLLQKILDLKCTLIDYEKIIDDKNRRLVFFGNYAGFAGMIDTLWALGQRLKEEGFSTVFEEVLPAHKYDSLEEAKEKLTGLGKKLENSSLPDFIQPITFGFLGYGNVSSGAQEILDCFPVEEIKPEKLKDFLKSNKYLKNKLYKTVYYEKDLVTPIDSSNEFELYDYYNHPEKYKSQFDPSPHTVIMNAIYWEKKYPRFVTKKWLQETFINGETPKMKVIGDISCDVNGAIQGTVKTTESGDPVFVYDPSNEKAIMGIIGHGPVIMAVDNLPCELPKESSTFFGDRLVPLVPEIFKIDLNKNFDQQDIITEIRNAIIVFKGELTPNFTYLKKYLEA